MKSLRVKKAALTALGGLLPGCVYTVAADLYLQPCRKEPSLKTSGITFQRSRCQGLDSQATSDHFTQFKPADSPQVGEERGQSLPTGSHLGMFAQFPGTQSLVRTGLLTVAEGFPWTYLNCCLYLLS